MKKWITLLAGLLAAQLVLAVAVNLNDKTYGVYEASQRLLVFDKQKINRLTIEDGEASLMLQNRDGQWLLPEAGDFPAAQQQVESLIDKLAGLEKGWPVATTSSASRRFKVSEDDYERKVTLYSDDDVVASLFVGSSPGFRKVHLRPDGEASIFIAEFSTLDADPQSDHWIDKALFKLDTAKIEQLDIGEELTLQRQQEDLRLVGLQAEERTNSEAVQNLAEKIGKLRIRSLLTDEESKSYRQKEPSFGIQVRLKEGRELSYQFFEVEDESHYVLKRSDRDHYFEVASNLVKPLREASREKLVMRVETEQDTAPEVTTSQNEID